MVFSANPKLFYLELNASCGNELKIKAKLILLLCWAVLAFPSFLQKDINSLGERLCWKHAALDLVSMLFSAFPVALQVDTFLTTSAEVIFLGALGVGIMAIMIAPFIKMFRDSGRNENSQRKIAQLEKDNIEDVGEEGFGLVNNSVFLQILFMRKHLRLKHSDLKYCK